MNPQLMAFDYPETGPDAKTALRVTILADRPDIRAQLRADAQIAGLAVMGDDTLGGWQDAEATAPGDLVLVDCPHPDAATLAALSRLDMRLARNGTRAIVATGIGALESVFACLDQSDPVMLVDPARVDWIIAMASVRPDMGAARVRELSEEDRLELLRLTQRISELARRLDPPTRGGGEGGAFHLRSPDNDFVPAEAAPREPGRARRGARPALPDPRLVRRIIRQRQLRARYFDAELFADPAWDILLDLTAARAAHERVSVTSLCIASGVPPTTALRWIRQMIDDGLLLREEDPEDRRRAFIALSDEAAQAMARYFAELGREAANLV